MSTVTVTDFNRKFAIWFYLICDRGVSDIVFVIFFQRLFAHTHGRPRHWEIKYTVYYNGYIKHFRKDPRDFSILRFRVNQLSDGRCINTYYYIVGNNIFTMCK